MWKRLQGKVTSSFIREFIHKKNPMDAAYVGRLSVENHISVHHRTHTGEKPMNAEGVGKHLVRSQPYCTSENSYRMKTL